jgi:transcriptional regulator with XRE-family HTH domain
MSNDADTTEQADSGFPELTPLGKHLEVLRIGRGISKQQLARVAGTSRQQLWRVMTGKSELTGPLRQRLADVLQVDAGALSASLPLQWTVTGTATRSFSAPPVEPPLVLERYLTDLARIERTIQALPTGAGGREVKRALLNALEDQAIVHRVTLGAAFFELRRRVLAGDL